MEIFLGNDRNGKPIYEGDWVLWHYGFSDEFIGVAQSFSVDVVGMQGVIQINRDAWPERVFCRNTRVISAEEAAIWLLEN